MGVRGARALPSTGEMFFSTFTINLAPNHWQWQTFDTARSVWVNETVERPSVCPSVCPISRQRRAADLLLSALRAEDIDR